MKHMMDFLDMSWVGCVNHVIQLVINVSFVISLPYFDIIFNIPFKVVPIITQLKEDMELKDLKRNSMLK